MLPTPKYPKWLLAVFQWFFFLIIKSSHKIIITLQDFPERVRITSTMSLSLNNQWESIKDSTSYASASCEWRAPSLVEGRFLLSAPTHLPKHVTFTLDANIFVSLQNFTYVLSLSQNWTKPQVLTNPLKTWSRTWYPAQTLACESCNSCLSCILLLCFLSVLSLLLHYPLSLFFTSFQSIPY